MAAASIAADRACASPLVCGTLASSSPFCKQSPTCWIAFSTASRFGKPRLPLVFDALRPQRLFLAQKAAVASQTEEQLHCLASHERNTNSSMVNDFQQEEEEEEQQITEESPTEITDGPIVDESSVLTVQALLTSYKEAISCDDAAKIADIESQLIVLEEARDALQQVAILSEEVSTGKDRLLRLNADFDNFRKRSERDKLEMRTVVKGDVIETLLPMVDSFERAKAQIKAETEGEEKIDTSYQGIYKQFVEILRALGVSVVETVGKVFNPNLHEAIMQEESGEYEEGVIIQEFRRGFLLGGKLLRPAMVKVSAGPGPIKQDSVANTEAPHDEVKSDIEGAS
eukprot:c25053_g1_i1 orf=500-1525(-)